MKKKERDNKKIKKKWTKPYLRNLKINNTFDGYNAGQAEGTQYMGTQSQ